MVQNMLNENRRMNTKMRVFCKTLTDFWFASLDLFMSVFDKREGVKIGIFCCFVNCFTTIIACSIQKCVTKLVKQIIFQRFPFYLKRTHLLYLFNCACWRDVLLTYVLRKRMSHFFACLIFFY